MCFHNVANILLWTAFSNKNKFHHLLVYTCIHARFALSKIINLTRKILSAWSEIYSVNKYVVNLFSQTNNMKEKETSLQISVSILRMLVQQFTQNFNTLSQCSRMTSSPGACDTLSCDELYRVEDNLMPWKFSFSFIRPIFISIMMPIDINQLNKLSLKLS